MIVLASPINCGKIYHVSEYWWGRLPSHYATLCGRRGNPGGWFSEEELKLPPGARLCKTCRRMIKGVFDED